MIGVSVGTVGFAPPVKKNSGGERHKEVVVFFSPPPPPPPCLNPALHPLTPAQGTALGASDACEYSVHGIACRNNF